MIDTSELDSNGTDKTVSLLKSAISAFIPVPLVGDILGELVSSVIPNQQIDRVRDCIVEIAEIVERNTSDIRDIKEFLERIKSNRFNTLLFEQTIRYAAQTESETKHHCYAYLLFQAIQDKTNEDIEKEAILKVVSELNEAEILSLLYLGQDNSNGIESDFHKKYAGFLDRHPDDGSKDDIKFNAMQEAYMNNLVVKGISTCVDDPKKGILSFLLTDFGKIVYKVLYDEEYFNRLKTD